MDKDHDRYDVVHRAYICDEMGKLQKTITDKVRGIKRVMSKGGLSSQKLAQVYRWKGTVKKLYESWCVIA